MKDAGLDHIAHQQWLINNNLANDLHKDTLFMYGAIIHKEVQAVELKLEFEKKTIEYTLYFATKILDKIALYRDLSASTSIVGLWRFKRMLKKEGNLNLQHLLDTYVKDYCGSNWKAELQLKDYKDYEDGFNREADISEAGDRMPN